MIITISSGPRLSQGKYRLTACKEISFKVSWLGKEKVRYGCTFTDVGGSKIGFVTSKD